jgi:RHS repeat-associated protein
MGKQLTSNRLYRKDVTTGDGTKVHYILDGQNRRVGKEVNGTLVQGFLYQNQINPVAELDGSGNVVQQYVYGTHPNVPDYIIQGANEYRVISDQVGSVRLVVDTQSGQVVEQIDYDSWGNVIDDTNPGFQPFGFAGGILDQDTFIYHFGARDYDPWQGRWLQKDPILFAGGETSLYNYAGNDPVNFIDPKGTDSTMPLGAPGSSAQIAQGAEAQQAEEQAMVNSFQQLVSETKCASQQFSKEFAENATAAQKLLGPVETLSSADEALKEASSDAAGTVNDITWENGGANATKAAGGLAAKSLNGLRAATGLASDASDIGLVLGSALDFGDAVYSAFEVAAGVDGTCCP